MPKVNPKIAALWKQYSHELLSLDKVTMDDIKALIPNLTKHDYEALYIRALRQSGRVKENFRSSEKKVILPTPRTGTVEISEQDDSQIITATGKRIKTLAQLLKISETNLDLWEVHTHKVNSWEVGIKTKKGTIETETLFQVTANLVRKIVHTVPTSIVLTTKSFPQGARKLKKKKEKDECVVVIPDIQIGYRWKENFSYLDPMHDRKAMDVVWQVCKDKQPETIVIIGDVLDYAAWSAKFHATADLRQTTQPALMETYWHLARLRMLCPDSEIVWVHGNHDERMNNYANALISEFHLLAGKSKHNVLSHNSLLQLDSLKIKLVAPYNSEYWLWDTIRFHHGRAHKTQKILTNLGHFSEVQGHTHRLAVNYKTVYGPKGGKVIQSLQAGCLCRIDDNVVPSVLEKNDWQQGFGIIDRVHSSWVNMCPIPITDGYASVGGKTYVGEDHAKTIAEEIEWNQITKSQRRAK